MKGIGSTHLGPQDVYMEEMISFVEEREYCAPVFEQQPSDDPSKNQINPQEGH
jgi:hypothetical protein